MVKGKAESKPKDIVPKVRLMSDDGVISTSPGGKVAADYNAQPVTSGGHQVKEKTQAKANESSVTKNFAPSVPAPKEKV